AVGRERPMRTVVHALLVGSLAACTGTVTGGAGGDGDGAKRDITPPTIVIDVPQRGTLAEGTRVVVSGRATDVESDISQVTINGQSTSVGPDGSFSLELEVAEGITLIESIATDAAGNQATDARAVLAGTLVPQTTPVDDGVAAHLSGAAMDGLAG